MGTFYKPGADSTGDTLHLAAVTAQPTGLGCRAEAAGGPLAHA